MGFLFQFLLPMDLLIASLYFYLKYSNKITKHKKDETKMKKAKIYSPSKLKNEIRNNTLKNFNKKGNSLIGNIFLEGLVIPEKKSIVEIERNFYHLTNFFDGYYIFT